MKIPTLLSKVNLYLEGKNIEGVVIEISKRDIIALSRNSNSTKTIVKQKYRIPEEGEVFRPALRHFFSQTEYSENSSFYYTYDEMLKKHRL